MLDEWIADHRPRSLRSDRLVLVRNRPVTAGGRAHAAVRDPDHRVVREAGPGRL
jgi:hypothetical protein